MPYSVGNVTSAPLVAQKLWMVNNLQIVARRDRAGLGDSIGCASFGWGSEGCGFSPRRVGIILSWRLTMKYFLRCI